MALVKCRECGKDVSTEASACPHCGAPRSTTSSSFLAPQESAFKRGPAPPQLKPGAPLEARLKQLREKRSRDAQRRTVTRVVWGGVVIALVGVGYLALQEAGSGSPWPLLLLINAGFAALIGYEADKRGRSWALYSAFTLIGTPVLSLIMLAIDAGNRPNKG